MQRTPEDSFSGFSIDLLENDPTSKKALPVTVRTGLD
jgi:hypothetical protein